MKILRMPMRYFEEEVTHPFRLELAMSESWVGCKKLVINANELSVVLIRNNGEIAECQSSLLDDRQLETIFALIKASDFFNLRCNSYSVFSKRIEILLGQKHNEIVYNDEMAPTCFANKLFDIINI